MSYLKFLGMTVLALLAIGLGAKLGGGAASFTAIVVSISLFWRYGPRIMAVGYTVWMALTAGWMFAIKALLKAAPQATAKYNPDQLRMVEGFWLLVGMLLLHPLCYWIGKLVAHRREANSTTA